jgi:hypothetical protein
MIWLLIIAPIVAWALTAWSYRIQAAVERKMWERKVAATEAANEVLTTARDNALVTAASQRTQARTWRSAAKEAERQAARLRQRLLLQAPRVFPAAPWSGEHLRVVPEGESPLFDALVAERAAVVPIKRAAKRSAVRSS